VKLGSLDLESCHDSFVCTKRLLCDLRLLSELLVFPSGRFLPQCLASNAFFARSSRTAEFCSDSARELAICHEVLLSIAW
jgi:hypothetical protein